MRAEVEFFGNWLKVSIIFSDVNSHGGVEQRIEGPYSVCANEFNLCKKMEYVCAIKSVVLLRQG